MTTFTHDHIHLYSADPTSTARFYQDILEGEIIRTHQDGRVDLRVGGQSIFVSPFQTAGRAKDASDPPYHFALAVADLDQTVRELKLRGAVFSKEPVEIRPGVKVAFMKAPDGLEIELLQRG